MRQKMSVQQIRRLVREESGAELVEFAMTALLLMALLVGMIGFSLAMYTYQYVHSAAEQGLRFAVVRGYTWSKVTASNCSTSAPPSFTMAYDCTASGTDVQNYVKSLATAGIDPSKVTVDTAGMWPGTTPYGIACTPADSQDCLVKVTVSYSFNFFNFYPFNNFDALSISSTAQGVITQ